MTLFYKPERARLGDTIPYFADGVFHVFYLKRYADDTHDRIETDWWHVSTTDFVDFEEHGPAVRRGGLRDADASAATGSVIRIGDRWYAYYTGFGEWQKEQGGRHQTVLRATSTDLVTWEKDAGFALVADAERYDAHEWRDPFVLEQEDGTYLMLIAGQSLDGPALRRGVTATATSPDGLTWTVGEPLWAPGLFSMHECPDLFRMGDRWYLVYSTLTDRTVTRYRTATSLEGPWTAPDDDELDGLGLYAAKTVSDGERRYLVGWCPNYAVGKDGAPWLWGGNLVVHELLQNEDGTLRVVEAALTRRTLQRDRAAAPVALEPASLGSEHGFERQVLARMPHTGLVDLVLTPSPGTKAFGVELRTDETGRPGYSVTVEPGRHRVRIDRLDRFGSEAPFDVRPFEAPEGELAMTVVFDGEVAVVYLGGTSAFTFRGYDQRGDSLAVFAQEGRIEVSGELRSIQDEKEDDR